MVDVTPGALALPFPEDSDPFHLLPQTVRDMADQLEVTAIPLAQSFPFSWTTPGGGQTAGTGNRNIAAMYRTGQDLYHVVFYLKFGTSPNFGSGAWSFALPAGLEGLLDSGGNPVQFAGLATYFDSSGNDTYTGRIKVRNADNESFGLFAGPDVGQTKDRDVTGTVPFAWAAGDSLTAHVDIMVET